MQERPADAIHRDATPEFRGPERLEWLTRNLIRALQDFVQTACRTCGDELRVPFSCKGRGFCPSCMGWRMAEGAALLVDHMLPAVGYRQWVLSFEGRAAVRLGYDQALLADVAGALAMTAVLTQVHKVIAAVDEDDRRLATGGADSDEPDARPGRSARRPTFRRFIPTKPGGPRNSARCRRTSTAASHSWV